MEVRRRKCSEADLQIVLPMMVTFVRGIIRQSLQRAVIQETNLSEESINLAPSLEDSLLFLGKVDGHGD
jgi:hypothetical protein